MSKRNLNVSLANSTGATVELESREKWLPILQGCEDGLERALRAAMRLSGCGVAGVFIRQGLVFVPLVLKSDIDFPSFRQISLDALGVDAWARDAVRLGSDQPVVRLDQDALSKSVSPAADPGALTLLCAAIADCFVSADTKSSDAEEGDTVTSGAEASDTDVSGGWQAFLFVATTSEAEVLPKDLGILSDIAAVIGALLSVHLDKAAAQKALSISEAQLEHFDHVTELAGVGGWQINPRTEEVVWTEQTCRIHDVPPDHRPKLQEWFDLCDSEYQTGLQSVYQEAVKNGTGWKLDAPMRTATGRQIWVSSICQPIIEDGEPRLMGSIMDVTGRRAAEREMDLSQRLYRSTLNALSEGILVADRDGIVRWHNGAVEAILDCTTIYEGMTHLGDIQCKLSHADIADFVDDEVRLWGDGQLLTGLLEGMEPKSLTIEAMVGPERRRKWLKCVSEPLISREDNAFVGLVISIEDITQMKRNEDIMSEAFEAIPNGFALYDQDDRLVMANGAYRKAFMDRKPSAENAETYRELLWRNLEAGTILGVGTKNDERHDWVEERVCDFLIGAPSHIVCLDDQRWIQTSSMVTPSAYRADYFADVSEIKKQSSVLEAVFENFPGGIALFDRDHKLMRLNSGMKALLGIDEAFMQSAPTLKAMIGRNAAREGLSGVQLDQAISRTIERFSQKKSVVYERKFSDGTVHEIRAIPLPDEGLLTTIDDITARRNVERRLKENERRAKEKNAELELTFASMAQGVSVFDRDGCLQIWNPRYIDIFNKPIKEIRQGISLKMLLEAEKQRGDFAGDVDVHISNLRSTLDRGEVATSYFRLSSGRQICSIHAPMPGGGWIGTHDEVDEEETRNLAF